MHKVIHKYAPNIQNYNEFNRAQKLKLGIYLRKRMTNKPNSNGQNDAI